MRTLPSAVQTWLDAGSPTLERNLIWITAVDATTYGFWDGETDETITVVKPSDGSTVARAFKGDGHMIGIPDNSDAATLSIRSLTFAMSGSSSVILAMLAATDLRGATIEWYKGYANPTTGALLANPVIEFDGFIDGLNRNDNASDMTGGLSGSTLEIVCVSRARELTRTSAKTRSYQHGLERSSDEIFKYAGAVGHWVVSWGSVKKSHHQKSGGKGHHTTKPKMRLPEHER